MPGGFVDGTYVELPSDATAMQFAPDGRLFVCQQSGALRVVQGGTLLTTPFLTLPVDDSGERGLLGVAFDPAFAQNHYVYVYYTATTPAIHNRVSRFTANGNVAVAGSEKILLELNNLSDARNHNGGAIHFGKDDKLYIAVGDNADGARAQTLGNLFGKVLRINKDGTIPPDNPYLGRTTGRYQSTWALGLRNPFTMAFQRSTGRLYINDVGQKTWEEVNEGKSAANYGWPDSEGYADDPAFTDPVHAYGHGDGSCAITGGAFYDADVLAFPSTYHGQYFFADYCGGWIRRLNPETKAVTGFAANVGAPVDLKVGPDGALYYLVRQAGRVGRISYSVAGQPPVISLQPADRTVTVGQTVTFSVSVTGSTPLAYQWRRNGTAISGATSASYTRSNVQLTDNGALFDVRVSNAFGTATSASAQLTVTGNTLPTAWIAKPVAGTLYSAGTVIGYAGSGSDAEDGTLPASAFTWWVDLHHDGHTHPVVLPVGGSKTGSFWIPRTGETSPNVFYRLHLRVRDSEGATRAVVRDIKPRRTKITLTTNPAGLRLTLDDQPVTAPFTFVSVEGMQRKLGAVSPQGASGSSWVFSSWSDGGTRIHTIRTPEGDTTYTARFLTQ